MILQSKNLEAPLSGKYLSPKRGVYQVINKNNSRIYVGQSSVILARWANHCQRLSNNTHINLDWQSDWNEHGPDVFEFSVIELVDYETSILERESFWIHAFLDRGVAIYNSVISNSSRDVRDKEEIRNTTLNIFVDAGLTERKSSKISLIKAVELLKDEFFSIAAMADFLDVNKSHIYNYFSGQRHVSPALRKSIYIMYPELKRQRITSDVSWESLEQREAALDYIQERGHKSFTEYLRSIAKYELAIHVHLKDDDD